MRLSAAIFRCKILYFLRRLCALGVTIQPIQSTNL